jgi:hypothetical protein
MKNVSNTYGYYLTEDSETVELQGNFKENFIYLPTKDPKEQLNYKVFVSPKKNVNFAIQIVGGDNPQVVYIPQHIYKDLDFAYYENNPYYTIKDITIVKLDFTDTGNKLITYLKSKFEVPLDNKVSRLENVGVDTVSYACFKNGLPNDEDILKQILFLFDEQNDVIFVDKNVKLVDESIVKERNYKSNRIKGNISYISNYFTNSGLFISRKLNSTLNILVESTLIYKVNQLSDFIKDFTDGRSISNQLGELRNAPPALNNKDVDALQKQLDAVNDIKSEQIKNSPKVLGMIMSGIPLVAPLVKGTLDKLAQYKKQNATKQLEEAKALGGSLKGQLAGGVDGIKGQATDAIDNIKGLFSTQKSLVSKYQSSIMLPPTNIKKINTSFGSGLPTIPNASLPTLPKLPAAPNVPTINSLKTTPSSIKQINADFLKF